jgi:hypothetical protein
VDNRQCPNTKTSVTAPHRSAFDLNLNQAVTRNSTEVDTTNPALSPAFKQLPPSDLFCFWSCWTYLYLRLRPLIRRRIKYPRLWGSMIFPAMCLIVEDLFV